MTVKLARVGGVPVAIGNPVPDLKQVADSIRSMQQSGQPLDLERIAAQVGLPASALPLLRQALATRSAPAVAPGQPGSKARPLAPAKESRNKVAKLRRLLRHVRDPREQCKLVLEIERLEKLSTASLRIR